MTPSMAAKNITIFFSFHHAGAYTEEIYTVRKKQNNQPAF
jgi:hypothetical protein